MKIKWLFGVWAAAGLFVLTGSAWAVTGENFDYHGYMRAGSGSNTNGGDQTCFHQSGIPGNEFRLGNECGIYGEAYLQAYTPAVNKKTGEFFRANFDVAYNPNGTTNNDPANLNIFGAFIEASHLSGDPETFWVGRRYYRDTDIHMDDFFYFADTSGSGAGVQDIPVGSGKLHLAVMFADETKTDSVSGLSVPVVTENGRPRTILFDTRLFDIKLAQHHAINFWGGVATSTGGTDVVTGVNYSNATGYVLGAKETYQTDIGYNRIAALYGHGLLEGMNLGGFFGADLTQTLSQSYQPGSSRWRFVEEFVFQPWTSFALAFATVDEFWGTGNSADSVGHWLTLGMRSVYFFSEHYSLAGELGVSNVQQPGVAQAGVPLVRGTIAPQISPKGEFFSRPVLRAFFTDTFGQGMSYGAQGEVWF